MESEKVNVSVLIPVRNEEKYIEQCILSLMKQDFPKENLEIILIDGNSEDGTAKIINKYMELQPGLIRLLSNPNLTVPYAMNIGIKASKGKYVIRIDAHSDYAKDYISKCVYYLENIDADNVGGPMVAKGKDNLQKIIAASYHSKFALGGGKFHDENYEGYADTVYLGAYKKDALVNIGMYDEKFTRNQDDELNYRLIKNGGKI
jgi:glycosyltransferase involved in cell wall biosynthesis